MISSMYVPIVLLCNFGSLFGSSKFSLQPGFSIDLNFQDVVTSKLKNLDVSVQNLEVMQ